MAFSWKTLLGAQLKTLNLYKWKYKVRVRILELSTLHLGLGKFSFKKKKCEITHFWSGPPPHTPPRKCETLVFFSREYLKKEDRSEVSV